MSSSKRRRVDEAAGDTLRSTTELYATPTQAELHELRETENLFKSNLFKLQIDELLGEIRVKAKRTRGIEESLHALKASLDALEDGPEIDVATSTVIDEDILPPIALGAEVMGGSKFRFLKPTQVSVVGSFLVKTLAKPDVSVDVEVMMPAETFQPKDHLNHRYFHKRAFYLAHLAAHLRSSEDFVSVEFAWAQGSLLRPILQVRPRTNAGKPASFVLNIFPGLPADCFKPSKLGPQRNNLRRKAGALMFPEGVLDAAGDESATPYYNNAILCDVHMRTHLALLHEYSSRCTHFAEAVLLLKVWLRQRGMNNGAPGTLGGFGVSMVLVYLFQARKIFADSSSFQLFRAVILFLASGDLTNRGVVMVEDGVETSAVATLDEFRSAFDAVLIDPTGTINVVANMSKGQHAHLQCEAKAAAVLLDDESVDGFAGLFIRRIPFHSAFDVLVCCSDVTKSVAAKYPAHFLARGGDWLSFGISLVAALLARGLGDRVALVVPETQARPAQSVTEPVDAGESGIDVRVGIHLVSEHASRLIDKGPLADAGAEADAFRAFWGAKAELRRFADGSIRETVSWEARASSGRIIEDISQYAILGLLTSLLGESTLTLGTTVEVATKTSLDVIQRLGELQKRLRELDDDIPLAISSVHGLSPVFRYAEPAFVTPSATASDEDAWPGWVPALEVQLQFEGTSQWPEDVVAIQKVKVALYVKLAEVLNVRHGVQAVPTEQYVDVFMKPYVFRIWIYVPLELSLARAQRDAVTLASQSAIGEDGLDLRDITAQVSSLDKMVREMERFYWHLPRHTAFLHSIQMDNQTFGHAVVLAKRWVGSQMLSTHFTDEAIELLVASVYTSPQPYGFVPGFGFVGFLRFLELVVTHDWAADPLIVSTPDFSSAEQTKTVESFRANRESFPPMTIFSVHSPTDSVWTQTTSKPMVARLVRLAKASVEVLRTCLESPGLDAIDLRSIFRADTTVYDALIHVKVAGVPRAAQRLGHARSDSEGKSTYKNLSLGAKSDLPRVDHDPPQLLIADLMSEHDGTAHFFYDKYGGVVIGVVWESQTRTPHPFKVAYTSHSKPSGHESSIHLNVDSALENFAILGGGLVSKVEAIS